jgi:hypothetical protein
MPWAAAGWAPVGAMWATFQLKLNFEITRILDYSLCRPSVSPSIRTRPYRPYTTPYATRINGLVYHLLNITGKRGITQ